MLTILAIFALAAIWGQIVLHLIALLAGTPRRQPVRSRTASSMIPSGIEYAAAELARRRLP